MISLAWFALFSWPLVAYVFFRNLSPAMALIATVLGAYLLLPSALLLDLPLLPVLDKINVASLTALVLTALFVRRHPEVLQRWTPRSPVLIVLVLLLVLGAFATVLSNTEPMFYGSRTLVGHSYYDAFSISLGLIVALVPFFLGRMLLSSTQAHKMLLKAIVVSACAYSLLALWEVRMSPQLHTQLYGYFPHSFYQQMRGDGFRPVVFTRHGLALALYFCFATIAAAVLVRDPRTDQEERRWWIGAMVWLFMVLVLCKSLGALLIAVVIVLLVLFCSARTQLIFAVCVAVTILTYPILRVSNLVPINQMMQVASAISLDRAGSLDVRIRNENALLDKAMEKPIVGLGIWGRSRIYDKHGKDVSVTDGTWVIELGQGGLLRYFALFGLLCGPILAFFFKLRSQADPATVGVVLLLCAKLIDIIPNSGIGPIAYMCAGALVGHLEVRLRAAKGGAPPAQYGNRAALTSAPRYARDFSKSVDHPANEEAQRPKPRAKETPRRQNKYGRMTPRRGYRA